MSKVFSLSEAKTQFPKIIKGAEKRDEEIVVTRNGKPAAVILNYNEFLRIQQTLEVLSDPQLTSQIKKSRLFFKKRKKGLTFEEVFEEPL